MVQLKGNQRSRRLYPKRQFQFLMVQLKVDKLLDVTSSVAISIPYGSIKRKQRPKHAKLLVIFQFLMVQLKEITQNPFLLMNLNFNSLWFN